MPHTHTTKAFWASHSAMQPILTRTIQSCCVVARNKGNLAPARGVARVNLKEYFWQHLRCCVRGVYINGERKGVPNEGHHAAMMGWVNVSENLVNGCVFLLRISLGISRVFKAVRWIWSVNKKMLNSSMGPSHLHLIAQLNRSLENLNNSAYFVPAVWWSNSSSKPNHHTIYGWRCWNLHHKRIERVRVSEREHKIYACVCKFCMFDVDPIYIWTSNTRNLLKTATTAKCVSKETAERVKIVALSYRTP